MKDLDKLRVLLHHWIEHNEEHANEFRRWANKAGGAAPGVLAAANRMDHVNQSLGSALEKLNGPVSNAHSVRHTAHHPEEEIDSHKNQN